MILVPLCDLKFLIEIAARDAASYGHVPTLERRLHLS
jgi:hypothetical protein